MDTVAIMSTLTNNTNGSASAWVDDLDSLWPDQTPFDVVWYGVLLIVLYSLVFTACVVGKFSALSNRSFCVFKIFKLV